MVSIIIVNYNTFEITCNCIKSVIENTKKVSYEIILVDNASPNDKPDEFIKLFPQIQLIKSTVNGGFAKGNNLGIFKAKGTHILLLNSDTILTEDSISIAYHKYISLGDVGALSIRLIYPDGKLQHTGRKFRSIKNELLDIARPILYCLSYEQRSRLMMNQYFKCDYNTYTDWVSGAFFMFDANILTKLPQNKLDERFFMYGEDQLWCYQFTQLGYKNYYLSETTIIHIHAASTSAEKQLKLLKLFLDLELKIIEYRYGKGLYYYCFNAILSTKENLRYTIKLLAKKMFNKTIR